MKIIHILKYSRFTEIDNDDIAKRAICSKSCESFLSDINTTTLRSVGGELLIFVKYVMRDLK